MPSDLITARDEIQAAFKAAWDPTGFPVEWEAVGDTGLQDEVESFARVVVRHTTGGQSALANHDGIRKFKKLGIITVQIFASISLQGGAGPCVTLAETVKGAFEGKATPSGVWFRNVRVNEIGVRNAWFQCNVIAEFEYEEYS